MTPGTSFRELIQHATAKSSATKEDFESAMAARGYKPSDIRKLGKAFDRVSSSGNEYILDPTKGFNVFGPEGQKTGSGKRKGNKAGKDLGDIIGLGNDVSLLAGALRKELPGYEKAKGATASLEPEHPKSDSPAAPVTKGSPTATVSPASTPVSSGTQGGIRKGKPAGTTVTPSSTRSTTPTAKEDLGNWNAIKNKDYSKAGKVDKYPHISSDEGDFFDMSGLTSLAGFSDLSRKTKDDLIAAGEIGAVAGPFSKAASRFYNRLMLPVQLMGVGANVGADALNPDRDIDWNSTGEDLATIAASTFGANLGNLMGAAGKASKARTASRILGRSPGATAMEEQLLSNQGLSSAKPSVWQRLYSRQAGKVRFPEVISEEGIEAGYGTPGSPEYFPEGGYKKGGKLPKAYKGRLLEDYPSEEHQFDFSRDPSTRGLEVARSYYEAPTPATQQEMDPQLGAEYGEQSPGAGNSGHSYLGGDILAGAVKYGIPAAYLAAEQHQINHLRDYINPHLTAPELMVGQVQDLARPDFSLPYDPRQGGSSLAEATNSGLARQKFTRSARNNFEVNNAMNRQAQRNAIIDRLNQQSQVRASTSNQEKLIRASNAMSEMGFLLGDRGQTAASLFGNLDNGIYGAQTARDSRNLTQAQEIVRNPERYNESDQQWARRVLGSRRKMGGKMKYSKPC